MSLTPGTGDTEGFNVLAGIDLVKLHGYLAAAMNANIRYGYGSKAPDGHLSDFPPLYSEIDCSGFSRCEIAYATNADDGGPYVIADGSVEQHDWAIASNLKPTAYSNAGLIDGYVRICFLEPSDTAEGIGHVWLVQNGKTIESHGGKGPDTRPWNTPILLNCHNAFVLC